MQNYVDLGCRIMRLSDEQSENVYFAYPLTLYTAYVVEGGERVTITVEAIYFLFRF